MISLPFSIQQKPWLQEMVDAGFLSIRQEKGGNGRDVEYYGINGSIPNTITSVPSENGSVEALSVDKTGVENTIDSVDALSVDNSIQEADGIDAATVDESDEADKLSINASTLNTTSTFPVESGSVDKGDESRRVYRSVFLDFFDEHQSRVLGDNNANP